MYCVNENLCSNWILDANFFIYIAGSDYCAHVHSHLEYVCIVSKPF